MYRYSCISVEKQFFSTHVSGQVFPVAAAWAWNSLPATVTSSPYVTHHIQAMSQY